MPSAHETYLLQRTSLFLRLITRFSNFSKVKANVKNRNIVEQMARDRLSEKCIEINSSNCEREKKKRKKRKEKRASCFTIVSYNFLAFIVSLVASTNFLQLHNIAILKIFLIFLDYRM